MYIQQGHNNWEMMVEKTKYKCNILYVYRHNVSERFPPFLLGL
jgi:hypothetical protein